MKHLPVLDSFVRRIAAWYSWRCPSCGTPRIEAVLRGVSACSACRQGHALGNAVLRVMTTPLKISAKELREFATETESMAVINAMMRGVSLHGLPVLRTGIPVYAVFDITSHCNLHCIHCYSEEHGLELSTKEVYGILKKLAEAGVGVIDFGGGEPLLRPDIFDILAYSKQAGMYTSITTNGTLLDEDIARRLKQVPIDHVCVSLDGASPQTHDHIRNKAGTFEKTLSGIRNCIREGIPTQVSTVLMKANYTELEDLIGLVNSLHVDGWYLYDFVPAGRGALLQSEMLSVDEQQHLLESLQAIAPRNPTQLKPYPYLITMNAACRQTFFYEKYGKLTELFQGCLTGRWTCHVSSNGDLHPCHLLPHRLGNLVNDDFATIWYNPESVVLTELRDRRLLQGSCGACRRRDVCGGCRAQAYWKTGSYLASDTCWITH